MKRLILLFSAIASIAYSVTIGSGVLVTDPSEPAYVSGASKISTTNCTTTPLGSNEAFIGGWESTLDFSTILVVVKADVDSATNGFIIQFSTDQTTIISDDTFTLFANGGKTYSFQPSAEWFRVIYTNGVSAQSEFSISAQLKYGYVKPSSHRIGDSIVAEDDAELTKSAITGEDDNGDWRNVQVTQDGNLAISDQSSGLSISIGNVTGVSVVHKFGNAPDFDTTDGEVTIWDGAEDGAAWENMVYDYSTTADIDSISSSDSGDTQEIEIMGLDANSNLTTVVATLSGQTRVALSTNFYRVFRAKNINSTDLVGHVSVYPNTALTAGVPTDTSKIRLLIHPENNQTEMAVFTIPANKTGYIRSFDVATAAGNKASNYIMRLFSRSPGGVFRLQKKISVSDTGTSMIQYTYTDPPMYEAGTDLEMTIEATAAGVTAASVSGGFDLVLVDD